MRIRRIGVAGLITEKRAWKIPLITGLFTCILGLSCCGVGLKLLEFKKSPSLPPIIAGTPMVVSGIAGIIGARTRKGWLVSIHAAFCLVVGVLSLHLINIFVVKEAKSRDLHWTKCQSNFKGSKYCHRYAATLGMAGLSVLAVTLAPAGIICCATKKFMTSQHRISEAEGEDSCTLGKERESKAATEKTRNSPPSRELQLPDRNYTDKHLQHDSKYQGVSLVPANHRGDLNNNVGDTHLVKDIALGFEPRKRVDGSYCPNVTASDDQTSGEDTTRNQCLAPARREYALNQVLTNVQLTYQDPGNEECVKQGQAPRTEYHENQFAPESRTSKDRDLSRDLPSNKVHGDPPFAPDNHSSNKQRPSNHVNRNIARTTEALMNRPSNHQADVVQLPKNHPPKNQTVVNNAHETEVIKVPDNDTSGDDVSSDQASNKDGSNTQAFGKKELGNPQSSDVAAIFIVPANNQVFRNHVPGNYVLRKLPLDKNVQDGTRNERQEKPKQNLHTDKATQKCSSGQSLAINRQQKNILLSNTTDDSFA
ncbi:uncharacterized protein [Montipora foliosa]|uniref:uncharacterized protein n=1 Tax=Montipora foliosa TaxID=591990 RepID=UPI0035F21473